MSAVAFRVVVNISLLRATRCVFVKYNFAMLHIHCVDRQSGVDRIVKVTGGQIESGVRYAHHLPAARQQTSRGFVHREILRIT